MLVFCKKKEDKNFFFRVNKMDDKNSIITTELRFKNHIRKIALAEPWFHHAFIEFKSMTGNTPFLFEFLDYKRSEHLNAPKEIIATECSLEEYIEFQSLLYAKVQSYSNSYNNIASSPLDLSVYDKIYSHGSKHKQEDINKIHISMEELEKSIASIDREKHRLFSLLDTFQSKYHDSLTDSDRKLLIGAQALLKRAGKMSNTRTSKKIKFSSDAEESDVPNKRMKSNTGTRAISEAVSQARRMQILKSLYESQIEKLEETVDKLKTDKLKLQTDIDKLKPIGSLIYDLSNELDRILLEKSRLLANE